jgi:ribonuclease-3
MNIAYRQLEKRIGYAFRNRQYAEAALTHRSFRYEAQDVHVDNQRLEFLGDAALGLVAGAHLFRAYPSLQEGELTRLRSRIASRSALAGIAGEANLGEFLRLGRGERRAEGHRRASTLADTLEAVLGAAYLDGGIKAVEKVFKKLFLPRLESASVETWVDNPKGALQEVVQRHWKNGPRYRIVREAGPAHDKVFTVEVLVGKRVVGEGEGSNKREAEMAAARRAIELLSRESRKKGGPSG